MVVDMSRPAFAINEVKFIYVQATIIWACWERAVTLLIIRFQKKRANKTLTQNTLALTKTWTKVARVELLLRLGRSLANRRKKNALLSPPLKKTQIVFWKHLARRGKLGHLAVLGTYLSLLWIFYAHAHVWISYLFTTYTTCYIISL